MQHRAEWRAASGRRGALEHTIATRAVAIAVATAASMAAAIATPLAAAILPVATARADEFTQHAAHEHGKATLDVAVDGGRVEIRLDTPAINVLGFERAPRTPAETRAAEDAAALLGTHSKAFAFPVAAKCAAVSSELRAPDWRSHGDHADHADHADYEVRWTFACSVPAALTFVDATFVAKLQPGTRVEANVITDSLQTQQAVRADAPRVRLK